MKADNAVIMAAGTSSRFAPLSFERHKALTEVRGEILIERQIRQLREAGVKDVYLVTGYKAEQFAYLRSKFGVRLIHNPDYLLRNNNGSIWAAKGIIRNSYICSADNYFTENPFEDNADGSYYAAEYSDGHTSEWCMTEKDGYIDSVTVGGAEAWYMAGHVFWDEEFSLKFMSILSSEYEADRVLLWEDIFIKHLPELKMRIRKYPPGVIHEFDTLDELREFDRTYIQDTRSEILRKIAKDLNTTEGQMHGFKAIMGGSNEAIGFAFRVNGHAFMFDYGRRELKVV